MADIEFGDLRNGGDRLDILERESVSGMRLDTVFDRKRSRVGDPPQLEFAVCTFAMRVFASMEFNNISTQTDRRFDLARVGLDEQADANIGLTQCRHNRCQVVMLACRIQPTLGRALLTPLGHDARSMRFMSQRDFQHFLGSCHLEVQRQRGSRHDSLDIGVADMPPVLTQMRGNSVAADRRHNLRRTHRIGMLTTPRIADGRDMIDVDT